jgi:hypothetical protein
MLSSLQVDLRRQQAVNDTLFMNLIYEVSRVHCFEHGGRCVYMSIQEDANEERRGGRQWKVSPACVTVFTWSFRQSLFNIEPTVPC